MLLLKNGAELATDEATLSGELMYAAGVASAIVRKVAGLNLVITSALDGEHNPGSLHPKGKAIDIRSRDWTVEQRQDIVQMLKDELDPMGFDICWEGCKGATAATTAAHVHIEFDPKQGETFLKSTA